MCWRGCTKAIIFSSCNLENFIPLVVVESLVGIEESLVCVVGLF